MSLIKRIGIGAGVAVFSILLLVEPVDAATLSCTIRNNGARSRNRCSITVVGRTGRRRRARKPRRNSSRIVNTVVAGANTGLNSANGNTQGNGGTVDVDPGNASVTVVITNTVNQ